MDKSAHIRLEPLDRQLLAFYKIKHELRSYSAAVRHAIEQAERGADDGARA